MPNGNSHGLVFGDDFNERPQKEQIDYLKKLCASQNDALDKMQQERNEWRDRALVLEEQVLNAQTAFDIQKDIVKNLVTKSNEDKEQYAKALEEMKRGDNN